MRLEATHLVKCAFHSSPSLALIESAASQPCRAIAIKQYQCSPICSQHAAFHVSQVLHVPRCLVDGTSGSISVAFLSAMGSSSHANTNLQTLAVNLAFQCYVLPPCTAVGRAQLKFSKLSVSTMNHTPTTYHRWLRHVVITAVGLGWRSAIFRSRELHPIPSRVCPKHFGKNLRVADAIVGICCALFSSLLRWRLWKSGLQTRRPSPPRTVSDMTELTTPLTSGCLMHPAQLVSIGLPDSGLSISRISSLPSMHCPLS